MAVPGTRAASTTQGAQRGLSAVWQRFPLAIEKWGGGGVVLMSHSNALKEKVQCLSGAAG